LLGAARPAIIQLLSFVIADAARRMVGDPNGAAGIEAAVSVLMPLPALPFVQTLWSPWALTNWHVRSGKVDDLSCLGAPGGELQAWVDCLI
jgi:hypothetical protein